MHTSTLKRAAALLVGAGALIAATVPAASADPAPAGLSPRATAAGDPTYLKLAPGATLASGQNMVLGNTTLSMQSDGNLVLYLNAANGSHIQVLWSTGTWNNPGAYAVMQTDGNFVIYRAGGESAGAVWSTQTWNQPGAVFVLTEGDLLVGSDQTGAVSWESKTGYLPALVNGEPTAQPADTIAPDASLGANHWVESSSTVLIMQGDGNLVLYRKSDGAAVWATGTWNHPNAIAAVNGASGLFHVSIRASRYWDSGSPNSPGAYVKVQGDGNVVLYPAAGESAGALWASGTWGKA
ncbi:hypothetical protein [Kitasatospora phosalacinea]|uniref:hypothetical protein n=1 Tax=Kitasatospora phosalacinea TaxID=2065 RepID=UPI0005250D3C|nr:hypothetical protein [Kitasatospora phosalacinea]